MLIVDAQVHICRHNKPATLAVRQVTNYTADDMLQEMDEGGVWHCSVLRAGNPTPGAGNEC
jgi:hypothetical protein